MGPVKIWVSKKFGFQKKLINLESRNYLGLKNFWVLKILGWKKLCPEKMKVLKKFVSRTKKFGSEKFWFLKNFGSWKIFGNEKILVSKKIWSRKNFGLEKNWVSKIIWVQKKLGPTKNVSKKSLGPKKIWVPKNLCHKKFGSIIY